MSFADQFLEIATALPKDPYIYGLGEHVKPLRLAPYVGLISKLCTNVPMVTPPVEMTRSLCGTQTKALRTTRTYVRVLCGPLVQVTCGYYCCWSHPPHYRRVPPLLHGNAPTRISSWCVSEELQRDGCRYRRVITNIQNHWRWEDILDFGQANFIHPFFPL